MPLHTRIRAAREAKNLTQVAAAASLGVPQSFMSNLERGYRRPNILMLKKIAKLFGVTQSYLLEDGVASLAGDNTPTPYDAAAVLKDQDAKPGLRDFAADTTLVAHLAITEAEWVALRSVELPRPVRKDDYLQLLVTIRGICRKRTRSDSRKGTVCTQQDDVDLEDCHA